MSDNIVPVTAILSLLMLLLFMVGLAFYADRMERDHEARTMCVAAGKQWISGDCVNAD